MPTHSLMRQAGRAIARLAGVPFSRSGQLLPDGGITPMEGWPSYRLGLGLMLDHPLVRGFLDDSTRERLRVRLDRHDDWLREFDACRSLAHGDFNPCNLLVKDDRIAGVLDWEFAHSGCPYMDIGNLLRELDPVWEKPLERGLKEEGFTLPEDWRQRARLIDLTSHLEFLTSARSDAFKRTRVDLIQQFLELEKD